jgi:hypothetical protein
LYLKKPYFALPQKKQFEQTLNSIYLKKLGFGEYSEDLKKSDVISFLADLGKYEKKIKKYNPDNNNALKILDKLLIKIKKESK